jgi:hypothetical protein
MLYFTYEHPFGAVWKEEAECLDGWTASSIFVLTILQLI